MELIVLIKRVILLKSGPAYKKLAIENQSGPMIPSVWQSACAVLSAACWRSRQGSIKHRNGQYFTLPNKHLES